MPLSPGVVIKCTLVTNNVNIRRSIGDITVLTGKERTSSINVQILKGKKQ